MENTGSHGAVLYVSGSADLYGSDRVLKQTVAEVAARGWRPIVALGEDGPLAPAIRASGVRVLTLRMGTIRRRLVSPLGALRISGALALSVSKLRRLAKAAEIEVVDTNTANVLSGAFVAKSLRIPHVWHVREHLGSTRGGNALTHLLDYGADSVVAVSQAVREDLCSLRPSLAPRVTVIADGVDLNRFRELPSREEAARRLGLDPTRPIIACVARINYWKGQDVLVEALSLMRPQTQPPQTILAGGVYQGDEHVLERLRARVANLRPQPDIMFLGFLNDPSDIYAAADVVVAPSTRPEPQGQSVIEALTAGVPVIASAEGGHLDSIRDHVDGILVPPRDPYSLADALSRLLSDNKLRTRLSAAASRDRVRFDPGPPADTLVHLYARLKQQTRS